MFKDEFQRLQALFQDAAEGKTANLEEVFRESLTFFAHLKDQIAQGTPEDRQRAMKMMSDLYSQMIALSKKICERSGQTEEQLMAFAENPANFSAQQWSAIVASREKMTKAGRDLAQTVENSTTPGERGSGGTPAHKRPKESKGKKSKWMRS